MEKDNKEEYSLVEFALRIGGHDDEVSCNFLLLGSIFD